MDLPISAGHPSHCKAQVTHLLHPFARHLGSVWQLSLSSESKALQLFDDVAFYQQQILAAAHLSPPYTFSYRARHDWPDETNLSAGNAAALSSQEDISKNAISLPHSIGKDWRASRANAAREEAQSIARNTSETSLGAGEHYCTRDMY